MVKHYKSGDPQVTVICRTTGKVRTLTNIENDLDTTGDAAPKGKHALQNNTDPKGKRDG